MRADGTEQVTYDGHPLYYFIADGSAGSTTGQGNDGFGAKWWLVAPSGSAITATA
jgi:predicted lipoprotein with Yx(FWY)xxD motif